MGRSNDLLEANTHVFVVRVWDERHGEGDLPPEVRGVIEHLPSGKRRHFTDLGVVVAFIASYLPPTSPSVQGLGRIRRWFCRKTETG